MERLTEKAVMGGYRAKNGYSFRYRYADAKADELVQKLGEYEDLEEQDLLLRLPCNPEDKIYAIHKEINGKYYVKEHEVSNINISKLFILIRCCDGFVFNASDMGKLAFLTQAEAEQKLKEMESES